MSERIKFHRVKELLDKGLGHSPRVRAAKKNWKELQNKIPEICSVCCTACHQQFSKDNLVRPPDWFQASVCKGFAEDGNENGISCLLHNETIKTLANGNKE